MLFFCLLILIGAIIPTVLTVSFSRGNLTSSFSQSHLEVTDTAVFILPAVVYTTVITIVITSFSIMVLALFVSHKIAGPFFRIEQDINVIATGDLTHTIYLRKKDQLKDLSIDINNMTSNLSDKLKKIQNGIEAIKHRAIVLEVSPWFMSELDHLQNRIEKNFKLSAASHQISRHTGL